MRVVPGVLSVVLVLGTPAMSYASPILFSITGTASHFGGDGGPQSPVAVTGYAVISDEPTTSSHTPPFGTDSMLRYDINEFAASVDGVGVARGTGFLHLEAEGLTWGELGNLATRFAIGFYRSDGTPYPPASGNGYQNFANYFLLAPIITLQTQDPGPHPWDGNFNLVLTAVPEPSALATVGIGLLATLALGLRRHWRGQRAPRK